LTLGFNAPNSHVVVDLEHCPVLTPRLVALLPPLRALLAEALRPGQRLDVAVLELAGTVDLGVIAPFTPTLSLRQRIAAFAREEDIARITWRRSDLEPPEPIIQQAPVRASFGGVAVDLPPGSFLQASAVGEAALTEFVTTWAEDGTTELFAGAGTFTLPLAAAGRQVRAYEGNGAMAAALGAAIRRAGLD